MPEHVLVNTTVFVLCLGLFLSITSWLLIHFCKIKDDNDVLSGKVMELLLKIRKMHEQERTLPVSESVVAQSEHIRVTEELRKWKNLALESENDRNKLYQDNQRLRTLAISIYERSKLTSLPKGDYKFIYGVDPVKKSKKTK